MSEYQIFPYSYWFQKTTGERLYSEADIQEFLQELSRPTPFPDHLAVLNDTARAQFNVGEATGDGEKHNANS